MAAHANAPISRHDARQEKRFSVQQLSSRALKNPFPQTPQTVAEIREGEGGAPADLLIVFFRSIENRLSAGGHGRKGCATPPPNRLRLDSDVRFIELASASWGTLGNVVLGVFSSWH